MTLKKDKILDMPLGRDISDLNDYQIVGLQINSGRFPKLLQEQIETEINNREINALKIQELKAKYFDFELISSGQLFSFKSPAIVILMVLVLFRAPLIGLSIVITSLIAIKLKFLKGRKAEARVWLFFKGIYLLLFIITIIVGLFIL